MAFSNSTREMARLPPSCSADTDGLSWEIICSRSVSAMANVCGLHNDGGSGGGDMCVHVCDGAGSLERRYDLPSWFSHGSVVVVASESCYRDRDRSSFIVHRSSSSLSSSSSSLSWSSLLSSSSSLAVASLLSLSSSAAASACVCV